jgi:hypothetical protein
VCEHCREAICCKCRREHYNEFCKYICLKLNETHQETEKLITKEGKNKCNVLFFMKKFILVQNLKQHEENVRHSNEIGKTIRAKVSEMISEIKQEEKKLIDNIQEFNNTEQRLVTSSMRKYREFFFKVNQREECSTSRSFKNQNILFDISRKITQVRAGVSQ